MKLTLQQKVLGGVMCVGLLAVGADRLNATSTASAGEIEPASLAVPQLPATSTNTVAAKPSLNAQLSAASADNFVASRGAFDLPADWQAQRNIATEVVDPALAAFRTAHRLTSIVQRGERSGAFIDGKLCFIGQSIDGYRLSALDARSAIFIKSKSQVVLAINAR